MKRFVIGVREIHVSHREVVAETYEDAVDQVMAAGSDKEIFLEYSDTMDREHCSLEEESDMTEEEILAEGFVKAGCGHFVDEANILTHEGVTMCQHCYDMVK